MGGGMGERGRMGREVPPVAEVAKRRASQREEKLWRATAAAGPTDAGTCTAQGGQGGAGRGTQAAALQRPRVRTNAQVQRPPWRRMGPLACRQAGFEEEPSMHSTRLEIYGLCGPAGWQAAQLGRPQRNAASIQQAGCGIAARGCDVQTQHGVKALCGGWGGVGVGVNSSPERRCSVPVDKRIRQHSRPHFQIPGCDAVLMLWCSACTPGCIALRPGEAVSSCWPGRRC